ncbi:MAG: hypothetical protein O2958_07245 [Gemmatimonadetes bacterium]|nr:hypothetical protein [Gemmatimonadota bacterium]MDA1103849.1 hypothetical protein [Gemmatimonadota bacterium]
MIRQAERAAAEITGAVSALMAGEVSEYRAALRAAGYTPFGEGPDR